MDPRFSARHKWDSWFWLVFWLYCFIVIMFGFRPPVEARFFSDGETVPATIALQAHVWSFSAWMSLLGIQAFLAGTNRMELHRFFGLAMLPLAAVMLSAAGFSEMESAQRSLALQDFGVGFRAVTFGMLITFAVIVPFAWVKRKDPPAHKRLILLATASIMSGAHFRNWGAWWSQEWFDESFLSRLLFYYGGTMILASLGMAYDLISRKALHPVYKIAVPVMLAWQVAVIMAYDSEWFPRWFGPIIEAY